jgi:dTDP-4-dehydrorhamnose reductase
MKLWVTGAKGMLGSALLELCRQRGVEAVGTAREEAGLCNLGRLQEVASRVQPTHIVNCAAYTDVDRAEKEPERSFAVNRDGAANMARIAKEWGARLMHISTDYVFSGTGQKPYKEEDVCAPQNVYGRSKWEGEQKILEILPLACILRTSWLFGPKGKNLISSLWQWFQQKEELQVVSDQYGKPTYCRDLAMAVLTLIDEEGTIHFANEGESSRYGIALHLWEAAKQMGFAPKCQRILPVPGACFPTPAPRPAYSVLDTGKYTRLTTLKPRHWGDAIQEHLKDVQI